MADVEHFSDSQIIDSLNLPAVMSAEMALSAIRYKPRPDDVFLVAYPKCGSTWSQHMLTLIFRKGVPTRAGMETFSVAPFLEATGAEDIHAMKRPGVIRTHLPFRFIPYSPEAKYIYVARNPKDCCVSCFHHMKNIFGFEFCGSFDEFFERFISGNIHYGDYLDHLLEWYDHRNDPNVLFVTYEEMKADAKAAALKFASFLGKQYVNLLEKEPKVLEDIIHYSGFGYMKVLVNESFDEIQKMDEDSIRNDTSIPEGLKDMFLKMKTTGKPAKGEKPSNNFVRKGIIGDWRSHFSEEQNKRMDEKISKKLKGTELMDLWKDFM